MLKELLNQKVLVLYSGYNELMSSKKGIITAIDDDFIKIDDKNIIAIKYIVRVEIL